MNLLNYITGLAAVPALPAAAYLALFTGATGDGAAFIEPPSGNGYRRVQIAGSLLTTSLTASGSAILNITGVPAWIQPGMLATDSTSPSSIPATTFVIAVGANSLTLSNILPGVASGDSIRVTSFGTEIPGSISTPFSLTNSAPIPFPQATPNTPGYGACPAFGIYDASGVGAGNLLAWDFFGLYLWSPFFSSSGVSASGAIFNQPANGYTNGDGLIVSAEFGGTLPTVTQGVLSGYALNYVANKTADAYTLSSSQSAPSSGNAVWTSNSGNGQARRVGVVSIPGGVQETIPPNNLFLSTFITPPRVLPLDLITGAAAAYSMRRLRTDYEGAPVNVRRLSDNTTQVIDFIGNNFDAVTFDAFTSGTTGFDVDWFDQSGNANNALNAVTGSTQPVVGPQLGYYGNIGLPGSTQLLEAPAAASINNIFASGGSVFVVANSLAIGGGTQTMCGKGGGSWAFYTFPTDGVSKLWFIQNGTGGLGFWSGNATVTNNAIHILEIQYDRSSSANVPVFAVDGVVTTIENANGYGGTPNNDGDTGLQLLNSDSLGAGKNFAWDGYIYEGYFFARILSPTDRATLIANLKAYYGIP